MSRILLAAKHLSQTQLDGIAHEQTIICKRLFAGHVMGSRPMKRKKNLLRVIMWWNCCYFFLNRKRWPWRTRWSNWSKGWEFVIESSFSWVVCNGLQHFVRTCTFCAIPSELALQHRYHEANTNFWNKGVVEGITGLKRPNPSNRIQF